MPPCSAKAARRPPPEEGLTECFEDEAGVVAAAIDLVGGEVQARFFLVQVTAQRLERVAAMIAAGELRTAVGAVPPLAAAHEAHEMPGGRRPVPQGKIVLRIRA